MKQSEKGLIKIKGLLILIFFLHFMLKKNHKQTYKYAARCQCNHSTNSDWVQFPFRCNPLQQVSWLQRNALWDVGRWWSQDGSEHQAEDRACCRKAANEVLNRKSLGAARPHRNHRAVEVVYGLGTFANSNRITKQPRIKSRMNSDEKEDCECAPPQAEISPAEGPYRWGRPEERVGDARRNTGGPIAS